MQFKHLPFDQLSLSDLYQLLWLRDEVFVVGQKITAEPEVDGLDPQAIHVLGRHEPAGRVLVTARLFVSDDKVKVGRVAVHPDLQRQGLGTQLMHYVHEIMQDRRGEMSAQAHLQPWYGSLGWQADGPVYLEAELPHVHMLRPAKTR